MRSSYSVSLSLGLFFLPSPAAAFCQATTCPDTVAGCTRDAETKCLATGKPLTWSTGCVTYVVQQDGSPKRSLSAEDLERSLSQATETWLGTDCGGSGPHLEINSLGIVECATPEFNPSGQNANVWMFRDDGWAYGDAFSGTEMLDSSAVAFTTLTYNTETGELIDADVEINSENLNFATEVTDGAYDLTTVVTHEMGHFLGLDHSANDDAVMAPRFPPGSARRELTGDDEAGICETYGTNRGTSSCEPEGGFSSQCGADQPEQNTTKTSSGCSVTPNSRKHPAKPWLGLLALLLIGNRLRRRNSLFREV